MCGICGIIRFDNQAVDHSKIKTMMLKQKHRGPNDEGIFSHNSTALGFVRLSILDLSIAGHQPMHDASGRYTMVFNGEIFNYIELRDDLKSKGISFTSNSDSEVLLKMYIYYGEDCLNYLNGMFAFAIYDNETGDTFAARDRFGEKPFYYYQDASQLVFASEIPPILAVYGQENTVNNQILFDYLAFNRTDQTEETFFNGVKKLQHGHYMTIINGIVKIKCWYKLSEKITDLKNSKDTYKDLLIDSVKIRLRSDVPIGVCLSGGLDSSTITSIITQIFNKKDFHTFSAVYAPGDSGDESKFINIFKDKLQNMHFVTPTSESLLENLKKFILVHTEPIPTTSSYAQYCVMQLAHENAIVTLDGQGSDEELGGYHYFFGFYFKDLLRSFRFGKLFKELYYYTKEHKSIYGIKTFVYFLLPRKLKTSIRLNEKGYIDAQFIEKVLKDKKSTITNDLYASKNLKTACLNHFEYKLEHLLKWSDLNSMAFSVESRAPFLDYRLVEFALSLKSDDIIKNGYTKSILRESFKGILPEEIRLRIDKIGFETPQDKWFRTPEFKELILEIIHSESFAGRGIINADKAKKLYQKHLNSEINISSDIWKWIHLELWYREFIDKQLLINN
jgi:asparagine synthase (glutamine-hydrolysing)